MRVQPEMKIKVWHWVVKVSTEAPDMSYLYKFPVELDDVEEFGSPADNEFWKCLEQLAEEGWLEVVHGDMNQTSYRFTKKLREMVCSKHGAVVTFGKYSKHPIFEEAQRVIDGYDYFCSSCVDEIKPEYDRYIAQYK